MTRKKATADRAGLMSGLGKLVGYNPAQKEEPETGYVKPKSRRGKAALLTQHDGAVLLQLKTLATQEETTQQKLVAEALNLLFNKRGLPQIA